MSCRYCNLPILTKAVPAFAYWFNTPFWCHPECKDAGARQEAFECQVIDADCNDCKHYKRGKLAPVLISLVKTKDGRIEEVRYQPSIIIGGHCLKFDKPTTAYPNKWTGHECFEHRRKA